MNRAAGYPPPRPQPFRPPAGRPLARPGRPPASPQPRQAAAAQTTKPDRTPMRNSTVLFWWRVFVVLSCLVIAALGPLVLNENSKVVTQVNESAQQVLRLEAVRADVLAADAAANNALVDARAGQNSDADHVALLSHAAEVMTEASAAWPDDEDRLAALNTDLIGYTAVVTRGLAAQDSQELSAASRLLDNQLLPALNEQIEINQQRLAFSIGDQRWLSVLMALPIAVLVCGSVVVARRTRRVFNIGLLIGLGLSIGVFVVTTQLVTTSANSVGAVQTGPMVQATSASGAYAAITEAKAWESRVLLGIATPTDGEMYFKAAVTLAEGRLGALPDAQAAGMLDQLQAFRDAHDKLLAAAGGDQTQLASARQDSNQAYQALVTWLPQQSQTIGAELNRQLIDQALRVRTAAGGCAGGLLLAGLAAGIGVSMPLRRYR